ncbi:fluoride efflux transporter CrcB [Methanocella arvoryzae]|uniref:Fluoride-specific ion channel FluC n=1 Tax=Methanocella arvoryzae (strain DSM 22066 / NBRC 105507 / MRE50) TaxID=351160 RepID=Q0W0T3_METAR|nr:fluoride efflux transporter CrcB [Methanocella arvoryzae]CAJ38010.1 putative camphor resistance protein [Methanocella arvoryzae MRE50]
MRDIELYLLVAAGGFAGASARYLINGLAPSMPGILLINVLGCMVLGFLLYASLFTGMFSPTVRAVFGSGFIGAFTTFSTFSVQTLQASPEIAILNVLGNLFLGLAGVLIGRQAAMLLARRPGWTS